MPFQRCIKTLISRQLRVKSFVGWWVAFFLGGEAYQQIVGYFMRNPLYTYIVLYIYDLIWLGFMAYQPV